MISLCASFASLAAELPHVLLITLDTTRADHLGFYGYERNTSPRLDELAKDSTVYTRAFSTSSWTLPAHASLFTGLFPTSHGARYDAQGSLILKDGIQGKKLSRFRASPLAPKRRVLAEILRDSGYATGALVAGPWMKRIFGLARGFDHYDDSSIDDVHGRLAADVTTAATAWMDARLKAAPAQPIFLFLNYYDPHGPYTDPEGYARRFLPRNTTVFPAPPNPSKEFLHGVYDGEIYYMDSHLGVLFDYLKAKGLYGDMLIVVTADHGELLGEHDQKGHGASLYQEELRIPFLVKHPQGEREPGRSEVPVQLTDVLPLVLERVGIAAPSGVQGAVPSREARPVYAEIYPVVGEAPVDWRVRVEGDFKYIWTSSGEQRLFDLRKDPGEESDLAGEQPERLQGMAERMQRFVAELPLPERASEEAPVETIDEETRRALEGLGYIE